MGELDLSVFYIDDEMLRKIWKQVIWKTFLSILCRIIGRVGWGFRSRGVSVQGANVAN